MGRNYDSLESFGFALNAAYKGMPNAIEKAVRVNVPSLVEKIKLRVSSTGKNASGNAFSTPYSRSHAYKRKKYGQGSLGSQTGYKGFFYQGTMWDNFKMLLVNNSQSQVTATLGFTGDNAYTSNQHLNEIHSKKEGIHIGAPNKDEARELTIKIGTAIGNYLNSVL